VRPRRRLSKLAYRRTYTSGHPQQHLLEIKPTVTEMYAVIATLLLLGGKSG
jgi:hypothetical protein